MVKTFDGISRREFLKIQFNLLNSFSPKRAQLTNKEIDVVIEFFVLPDMYKRNRFSSAARNYIVKSLESQGNGLNNATLNQHVISLQRKGIFEREVDNTLIINKAFKNLLDSSVENYEIKFVFKNVQRD